ncbi:MAG TPA: tetratricopeptide repeat protein [Vicinamibacterales bacterium]|jgi:tetratricopeptide (TPR) repeat protein
MIRLPAAVASCLLAMFMAGAGASAQTPAGSPPDAATPSQTAEARRADAYYQFVHAQQLETDGDAAGAITAFERAAALDPTAAAIPAELATLYMKQGRLSEATDSAQAAIKIDPANVDAHRVLGLIDAARVRGDRANPQTIANAISELEQAQPPKNVLPDPNTQITLGQLYIRTETYDKAIPVLKRLVGDEPGWVPPVRLLAEAYVGAGQEQDALDLLRAQAQDNPQLNLELAALAEQTGHWSDAAAAYEHIVAQTPDSVPLRTRWAAALLHEPGKESATRAHDILTKVVGDSPNDAGAMYLLAEADRQMGDLDAAESTAKQLIAVDKSGLRGHYALVQVLEDRHQYRQVVEDLAPLLSGMASDVPDEEKGRYGLLLLHLGFAYQNLQDWDQAIQTFEQARSYSPKGVDIDLYLVQVNVSAKRYKAAIDLAEAARQKTPDDTRLAALEAQALRQTGQFDRGVELLQAAVQAHPDDLSGYLSLAQLYSDGGQGSRGVDLLKSVAPKFSGDTRVDFALGTILDNEKKYDEAERAMQQVIKADPQNAPALNYLGYMLADRGDRLDESVGYIKRALEIDPGNSAYLDSLGWAYFKQHKLDLAEQNLSRAASDLTSNSVVQDHYAQVLFKKGRYADAIEAWKRALAGDGTSIDRTQIQKQIKTAQQRLQRR